MADDFVVITAGEAESLEELLDFYIIQQIRDDPDYDNMRCLANLVHVWEKCSELVKKERNGG